MAKPVFSLDVELQGQTHRLDVKSIELVRAEALLQTSIGKLEPGMTMLYQIAWATMVGRKIDGVPDTFDAFLALDPDVQDATQDDEAAGGKGSVPARSTG